MKIPIYNLYFLLAYAWDLVGEAGSVETGADQCEVPEELFALVLRNGIRRQRGRGLDRGYRPYSEALTGLRGKVDLASSMKAQTWLTRTLQCEFDELSFDIPANQILKATLSLLIETEGLSDSLREDLRDLRRYFRDVSSVPLSESLFRRVQLHSNNRSYALLLRVCELLYQQLLPTESGVGYRFVDVPSERLETLFEDFLRNFYAKEQEVFSTVKREYFPWRESVGSAESLRWLPRMQTDICLSSDTQKLVVDAKFYADPFSRGRFGGKDRLRSTHIYQLFAYLKNVPREPAQRVDGMLVYAQSGEETTASMEVQGHRIVVATVNLMKAPGEIRDRLRSLVHHAH